MSPMSDVFWGWGWGQGVPCIMSGEAKAGAEVPCVMFGGGDWAQYSEVQCIMGNFHIEMPLTHAETD